MTYPQDPLSALKAMTLELQNMALELDKVERDNLPKEQMAQFAVAYKKLRSEVEKFYSPENYIRGGRPVELDSGTQSKQFMIDVLPLIQKILRGYSNGTVLEALDVGCATGHGANLLASLYQTERLGYRIRLSALDIEDAFNLYTQVACPYIRHIVDDIYQHQKSYDLVICSHVVEHVPEPFKFINRLRELSRGKVIIIAPFDEPKEGRTFGHINSFNNDDLKKLNAEYLELMESEAWGRANTPRYKMFVAVIAGTA